MTLSPNSRFKKALQEMYMDKVGTAMLCARAQSRDANGHALGNAGRSPSAVGIINAGHNKNENWSIVRKSFLHKISRGILS